RARALAQLAEATFGTRQVDDARRLVDDARRTAEGLDDQLVHGLVAFSAGLTDLTSLHLNSALTRFDESRRDTAQNDPWFEAWAYGRLAFSAYIAGAFDMARQNIDKARESQHALRFWSELSVTESVASALSLLNHNAVGAVTAAEDAIRYCDRSGYQ